MLDSNSVNNIHETEKPKEAVVECTNNTKKAQRLEATSKECIEFTKRGSTTLELKVEPEKRDKSRKRVRAQLV